MSKFRELTRKQLVATSALFDVEAWKRETEKRFSPLVAQTLVDAINRLVEEEIDLTHPVVRAALGQRLEKFSRLNETTSEQISALLRSAHADGLSIDETAGLLDDYFDEITPRRANLIARTETYGAYNHGTQHGFELGGWERKMWITSRDERVRESHRIDGQVVPVDRDFILADGTRMPYPQDYNERCVHIATQEKINVPEYGAAA